MQRYSLEQQADKIEMVLHNYRLPAQVWGGAVLPNSIRYYLRTPVNIRVQKVAALAEEIALALGVPQAAVFREKDRINVEVPRATPGTIRFATILQRLPKRLTPLQGVLGQDSDGLPLLLRLDAPVVTHVLVAGTTGSGKTVLMRQFLLSLAILYRQGQVQLLLIDPKRRGLQPLARLPHLWQPLASTGKDIRRLLTEVLALMEERDRRGISWPKIVVAVDEVAEVAMTAGPPAMAALTRIAQRGREAGMHLVASTQKPTSSLLGPLLKGNFPTRIVGAVANSKDAWTASGVADSGAEKLSGSGQFLAVVRNQITRFQSSWLDGGEIQRVTTWLAEGQSRRTIVERLDQEG